MNDTTKIPHCPICGHAPETQAPYVMNDVRRFPAPGCTACGFGTQHATGLRPDDAVRMWARLVRAELARQALEMRAHSAVVSSDAGRTNAMYLHNALGMVLKDYEVLGQSPIHLPGDPS